MGVLIPEIGLIRQLSCCVHTQGPPALIRTKREAKRVEPNTGDSIKATNLGTRDCAKDTEGQHEESAQRGEDKDASLGAYETGFHKYDAYHIPFSLSGFLSTVP